MPTLGPTCYAQKVPNIQSSKTLKIGPTDLTNLSLGQEQERLFNIIENTGLNLFVTGRAGTGKSVLLQYLRLHSAKKLVVVAPTGVSALNVGGQTIHSLFKIPPELVTKEKLQLSAKTEALLANLDAVIIDEISMVRADLMDGIEIMLRRAKRSRFPFGGVQLIMFGDLYQLPPVIHDQSLVQYFKEQFGGHYFFHAHCFRDDPPKVYELTENFRQRDSGFRAILNQIRGGELDHDLLESLNCRVVEAKPEDGAVTVVPTNSMATRINQQQLQQLAGSSYKYEAKISGELESFAYPTEELLELKVGAQIMFLKNDPTKRFVNGTIGKIVSLSRTEIRVSVEGKEFSLLPDVWNKVRYHYQPESGKVSEEIVSSFTQFPIRLAWAITIHKSQGQTYDSVVVDMGGGAFAHGQTYVALSRCTTLEGLFLKRPIRMTDIMVEPEVIRFLESAEVVPA